MTMFADRGDAGRRLAAGLAHRGGQGPEVLGLARGGVPVAAELRRLFGQGGPSIAERLHLTLDTSPADIARVAAERHAAWAARRFRSGGVLRILCEHAVDRLDYILDRVEGVCA